MLLDGRDIQGFIKQRHYQQVWALEVAPKLKIFRVGDDPATDIFTQVKINYGEDIGAEVEVERYDDQKELLVAIKTANNDAATHGIIVQLPLPESFDTDKIIQAVARNKDIDGLGADSPYDPPAPSGIIWLLGSYGIPLKGQTIAVLGQGRLVGRPLTKMLQASGAEVITADEHTKDIKDITLRADIVISATGQPGLLKPEMVRDGAVVVDAGSGSTAGQPAGDADPELFKNKTLKITPNPGGVGPMTVTVLFENLLSAARAKS